MLNGILGRKIGMTQIFTEKGETIPVTVIEAGPCVVTQLRTKDKDGYEAVQLGFGEIKPRKVTKPIQGHLKAAGRLVRFMREVKTTDLNAHNVGDVVNVDIFQIGEKIDVVGTSKGRGFAGVVKRHGFRGGPATHGQSDRHRAPGSIGSGTTPGRVWKNMRMAGRMGNDRVTVQNLEVVKIDLERHVILVKGSVPGAKNGLVMVSRAAKATKK
ncbi:MAG TPA: 50S ribosomal protein L3 [Herpetosiphon sp.]|uniref:Large ribosomal subunit protein uL3 n=1 Tax=Herpetosiphon aurantiacus (strain ATCC 23779 / DSM 785 / 114-95) TaxID=316274 RepID=RL3_HERA2|nr:50S ribosomal protein L3 [Herpetosiphon sp.]A9B412.1 RecName: Full=Large ribosomal subunit protein uL3; AltName: Full=50S ribosomal protein L3 [Herpetosiphon aurantiacus DSM 785]ABX07545.1 ribosomal protein L3 [Herpetosiphon aurantiacus DSM 785]HBW49681.1 50S ribosomal protein L3 [Herpetosiphon sp.]